MYLYSICDIPAGLPGGDAGSRIRTSGVGTVDLIWTSQTHRCPLFFKAFKELRSPRHSLHSFLIVVSIFGKSMLLRGHSEHLGSSHATLVLVETHVLLFISSHPRSSFATTSGVFEPKGVCSGDGRCYGDGTGSRGDCSSFGIFKSWTLLPWGAGGPHQVRSWSLPHTGNILLSQSGPVFSGVVQACIIFLWDVVKRQSVVLTIGSVQLITVGQNQRLLILLKEPDDQNHFVIVCSWFLCWIYQKKHFIWSSQLYSR